MSDDIKPWGDRAAEADPKGRPQNWPASFYVPFMHAEIMDLRAALAQTETRPSAAETMLYVDVRECSIRLPERIAELVAQHGSLRAAARVLCCDAGYLSRLQSGEKTDPGDLLLRRMGLRAATIYTRMKP